MDPVRPFALVLAGGEGKRLWPLTIDRAKPAVPFGGNYRLIDFALSNLVNGGLPPDRRPDAVQEPQPRPPRRGHLAALDAVRQLRRAGAGPDAPRPALVLGLGRRDLPEPEPDLRRAARRDLRLRRRPRLPDRPAPDGAPASRERRRRHGRRAAGADRAGARVRGDGRLATTAARSSRSARSRSTRSGCPTRPTR